MRKLSAQLYFTFCVPLGQTCRVGNTPSTGLTTPRGVARSNTTVAGRAAGPGARHLPAEPRNGLKRSIRRVAVSRPIRRSPKRATLTADAERFVGSI